MAAAQGSVQNLAGVVWLVAVVAVFYFFAIRPQQKRAKEHEQLVAATKVGDKVVTIGGMHGTVKKIDGETVTLQVAKGTSVVLDKSAVGRKDSGTDEEGS